MRPDIAIIYIHVPGDLEFLELTRRFVYSYHKNPPGIPHRTIVVSQPHQPTPEMRALLFNLPNCEFVEHDNTGWDIGAFIALSKKIEAKFMVCFGGSAYVQRPGWLKRMNEVWESDGEGFYGTLATYEISPHINTSGFFCAPKMLADYPIKVVTKAQRYDFEHGRPNAMWKNVHSAGGKVRLVTWDGVYEWQDWRKPKNIYRRGDQSNCLTGFRHSHAYAAAHPQIKRRMEALADTITDPNYLK